ncbi:MAG: hypothetical protein PHQ23_16130 [Candidatus Wallbacteria bacterium]|nr:hypothetical protein [Candidatus Wallbacteria bacterium]
MDKNQYAKRVYRENVTDKAPQEHFYDEIEEKIHDLLSCFSDLVCNIPKNTASHPRLGELAQNLIMLYSDYYYDYPAMPEHAEAALMISKEIQADQPEIKQESSLEKLRQSVNGRTWDYLVRGLESVHGTCGRIGRVGKLIMKSTD